MEMRRPGLDGAAPGASPFRLDDDLAYGRWRDWKLRNVAGRAEDLIVEVRSPLRLSASEQAAIRSRLLHSGAAIYVGPEADGKRAVRRMAAQLGMRRHDRNWLADEDGVSWIRAGGGDGRGEFIPYTSRALSWHTDGYYNPPERSVRGFVLHCVRRALDGGGNSLLDHELAYIHLRDQNREAIRALMAPDAMTIPARADERGVARPAQAGAVFHIDPSSGQLGMRYTARTRSVEWKGDAATLEAASMMSRLLGQGAAGVLDVQLQPGMGIVARNVLHNRAGFHDDPARPRLMLRIRSYDAPALPA